MGAGFSYPLPDPDYEWLPYAYLMDGATPVNLDVSTSQQPTLPYCRSLGA